jgi:hypothetical protein
MALALIGQSSISTVDGRSAERATDGNSHREDLVPEETFPASDSIATAGRSPTMPVKEQTVIYKSRLEITESVRRNSIARPQVRLSTAIALGVQLRQFRGYQRSGLEPTEHSTLRRFLARRTSEPAVDGAS